MLRLLPLARLLLVARNTRAAADVSSARGGIVVSLSLWKRIGVRAPIHEKIQQGRRAKQYDHRQAAQNQAAIGPFLQFDRLRFAPARFFLRHWPALRTRIYRAKQLRNKVRKPQIHGRVDLQGIHNRSPLNSLYRIALGSNAKGSKFGAGIQVTDSVRHTVEKRYQDSGKGGWTPVFTGVTIGPA